MSDQYIPMIERISEEYDESDSIWFLSWPIPIRDTPPSNSR